MHIRVSITKNIKTKTSVINVIGLSPYTFNSPFRYFGFVSVFGRFGKSRYPYLVGYDRSEKKRVSYENRFFPSSCMIQINNLFLFCILLQQVFDDHKLSFYDKVHKCN